MLIALLVAAAVALVLGILLSNAVLIVVSLVLCGVMAVLLWRTRSSVPAGVPDESPGGRAVSADALPSASSPGASAAAKGAEPALPPDSSVWVVDGMPDYHRTATCSVVSGRDVVEIPLHQAAEDGFARCGVCADAKAPAQSGPDAAAAQPQGGPSADAAQAQSVLVVDGLPDYHDAGCVELVGKQDVEIPLQQAVEDGFTPCRVCVGASAGADEQAAAPPTAPTSAFAPVPPSSNGNGVHGPRVGAVWVVDGEPEYHRQGCTALAGKQDIEIPYDQAVEDGFRPCSACVLPTDAPVAAPPASVPAAGAAPTQVPPTGGSGSQPASGQVWVVDGEPQYHDQGCHDLTGKPAVAIPHDQAVEDGFVPCEECGASSKLAAGAAASAPSAPPAAAEQPVGAPADGVLVVDGQPDYHRAGCGTLTGQPTVEIPRNQAVEDGFRPCAECAPDRAAAGAAQTPGGGQGTTPDQAWVVDGYAHYHRQGCVTIADLPAEPLPFAEAVELGFAQCSVCFADAAQPESHAATQPERPAGTQPSAAGFESSPREGAAPPPSRSAGNTDSVWVVDGFLNFHRQGCVRISGADAVAIPVTQAVEDGFQPCSFCRPPGSDAEDGRRAEASSAAAGTTSAAVPAEHSGSGGRGPDRDGGSDEVWVIDGQPLFHAHGCARAAGQDVVPIPRGQAVEDGFRPCDACQPAGAQPSVPVAEPAGATAAGATAAGATAAGAPPAGPPPAGSTPAGRPTADSALAGASTAAGGLRPAAQTQQVATQAPPAGTGSRPEQAAGAVLVMEGRPRFHLAGCLIVKGQPTRELSREQAIDEGFKPCSLCGSGG